jgi:hypothetical protein
MHSNLNVAKIGPSAVYFDTRLARIRRRNLHKLSLFAAALANDELTIIFNPDDKTIYNVSTRIRTASGAVGNSMRATQCA